MSKLLKDLKHTRRFCGGRCHLCNLLRVAFFWEVLSVSKVTVENILKDHGRMNVDQTGAPDR
jgi:hypothetical protein